MLHINWCRISSIDSVNLPHCTKNKPCDSEMFCHIAHDQINLSQVILTRQEGMTLLRFAQSTFQSTHSIRTKLYKTDFMFSIYVVVEQHTTEKYLRQIRYHSSSESFGGEKNGTTTLDHRTSNRLPSSYFM